MIRACEFASKSPEYTDDDAPPELNAKRHAILEPVHHLSPVWKLDLEVPTVTGPCLSSDVRELEIDTGALSLVAERVCNLVCRDRARYGHNLYVCMPALRAQPTHLERDGVCVVLGVEGC